MRTWSNREKQRGVGLWMVLQIVMPERARSLTTSTTCTHATGHIGLIQGAGGEASVIVRRCADVEGAADHSA